MYRALTNHQSQTTQYMLNSYPIAAPQNTVITHCNHRFSSRPSYCTDSVAVVPTSRMHSILIPNQLDFTNHYKKVNYYKYVGKRNSKNGKTLSLSVSKLTN